MSDLVIKAVTRKPVQVEAAQLTEINLWEMKDWCGGRLEYGDGSTSLLIKTLEGTMKAEIGDWIIQGVEGEFYPCKPGIFEQIYEVGETLDSDPHLCVIRKQYPGAVAAEVDRTGRWDYEWKECRIYSVTYPDRTLYLEITKSGCSCNDFDDEPSLNDAIEHESLQALKRSLARRDFNDGYWDKETKRAFKEMLYRVKMLVKP